jgi:nucleoside-diphosphate-sugar epimerase
MRVVVIGATGNVGTSLLESLEPETQVDEIVAVARRAPGRAGAPPPVEAPAPPSSHARRSRPPTSRRPTSSRSCAASTPWSTWPG